MGGAESFDAVWLEPKLNEFRRRWRELWGVAHADDEGTNAAAYLCRRVASAEMEWSKRVALMPCNADDRLAGWDTWRIERPLRGTTPPFTALHLRYLAAAEDFTRLPIPRDTAVLGACVAAP